MRRAGIWLFAAVPVIVTAVVYAVGPDPSDTGHKHLSAAQQARQDAKERAESERAADEEVIADAPPGLAEPHRKELAQELVASAENSTLHWKTTYEYIEDSGDGQGYTAGIVGFCTGTHDLLTLVERYTRAHPHNGLAPYLPALRKVDGTGSHAGLGPRFTAAWKAESRLPAFRRAQNDERDRVYFDPAVRLAKLDGLGTLGQFVYYDAMVFHGPGTDANSFYGLRERALREADTPSEGGSEKHYLDIFLDIREKAMRAGNAAADTSRIDTAQRRFLDDGNMDLHRPLEWQVYGETYRVP